MGSRTTSRLSTWRWAASGRDGGAGDARNYDYDLFVVGGGSGGVRCARIAAGHGARVGIAEDTHWGGTCVNVGCVPKKIMVLAAEYGRHAADSHGFGWDTQSPHHDWATLMRHKDAEIGRLNGIYKKMLDGAGVERHEAHASFTGPHTLALRGTDGSVKTVTAERIVVATGGTPIQDGKIEGGGAGHHLRPGLLPAVAAEARPDGGRAATSGSSSPGCSAGSGRRWTWCIASTCRCGASTTTCARPWSQP